MKRTPIEALEYAIQAGFLSSRRHAPGIIVAGLDADVREALARLKSDEIGRVRLTPYLGICGAWA